MGPQAFEILHKLKLQTPLSYYNLDFDLSSDKKYYLRYDEQNKHKNKVVDSHVLWKDNQRYQKEIANKSLLQISEYINTKAGVVLYVQNDFIYGEIVLGEPALILRRGICKRRFLIVKDSVQFIEYGQSYCYFQNKGFVKNTCSNWEFEKIFKKIVDTCFLLLNEKKTGYIFEVHMTKTDTVYTDAKTINSFNISYEKIATFFNIHEGDFSIIKGVLSGDVICDKLDIDIDKCWRSICIYKGALLSHYVTYYYESIENLILVR